MAFPSLWGDRFSPMQVIASSSLWRQVQPHAMAQVVGCHLLTEGRKAQSQASPCGICGEQSGTKVFH